jgi:hypothetical protein
VTLSFLSLCFTFSFIINFSKIVSVNLVKTTFLVECHQDGENDDKRIYTTV